MTRLFEVLNGKEANYLLPFYWQHGNHTDRIPTQVQRIYDSGCRALCVESRTHEDFAGEGWWRDMDIILAECEKRGMRVWILDDKHFPTGYANGGIQHKAFHLRQWELVEHHIDVIGPMANATLLVQRDSEESSLIGVYAYRRVKGEEVLTGDAIPLTEKVKDGYLYWDIPEGCYRIFFLYKSRRGGRAYYIDMISDESVQVLVDEVYEPHYQRYAHYFGNTLAGFFSDEPSFGNMMVGKHRIDTGMYDRRMGTPGLALPYNENLLRMMSEELGEDAMPYLATLWYKGKGFERARLAYMNAATRLYRDCFTKKLGDWCRERGVEYIGHIIEDQNAHARLHCSGGHYYRSLWWQDMSGIDIVLHQVMPGFADYIHTAIAAGGVADPNFYHYVLGQLAASMAHALPHMKGRAMCEVFGAYGWGEGTPMMKWLMDFLMVRGVNHFVPHAFSPNFPDGDCPPHFGAEGHDPQFDGFSALMGYTNKVTHLLYGGVHKASAAIFYHAEGEWMNARGTAMLTEVPARKLFDRQINYDIVCADMLFDESLTAVKDGKLYIGEECFGALIMPYAKVLPEALLTLLNGWAMAGLEILYVDSLTDGAVGKVVKAERLADYLIAQGICDIALGDDYPHLRYYHTVNEGKDVYFFFNESPDTCCSTKVKLTHGGKFVRLRLLDDLVYDDETLGNTATLDLIPGQSEVWVFGEETGRAKPKTQNTEVLLAPTFTVSLADSADLSSFRPYMTTDRLPNITGPDGIQDFGGKMRYGFTLTLNEIPENAALDLGVVGETAKLFVNGKEVGIRVAEPYLFSVDGLLKEGDNEITVEVANTLAYKERDSFSFYLTLRPSGLLGPVKLLYTE